jgi:hypothetical protein
LARQLARRRQRERAAGAAIAALGVVVLVVAIFALRHPRGAGTVAGSDTRPPSSSSIAKPAASRSGAPSKRGSSSAGASSSPASSAGAAAAKLPLVVLNDTTISGLGKQAAGTFEAGGWRVTQVGNLQNDILSTCAYYDPSAKGARASAELLQRQFPAIKRVVPKFAELPPGPIVVVLTPDYPSG